MAATRSELDLLEVYIDWHRQIAALDQAYERWSSAAANSALIRV